MTAPAKPASPDLYQTLREELVLHPYRTVAIAAGAGYLLGTRFGAPLIALLTSRMGVKIASLAIVPLLERSRPGRPPDGA